MEERMEAVVCTIECHDEGALLLRVWHQTTEEAAWGRSSALPALRPKRNGQNSYTSWAGIGQARDLKRPPLYASLIGIFFSIHEVTNIHWLFFFLTKEASSQKHFPHGELCALDIYKEAPPGWHSSTSVCCWPRNKKVSLAITWKRLFIDLIVSPSRPADEQLSRRARFRGHTIDPQLNTCADLLLVAD